MSNQNQMKAEFIKFFDGKNEGIREFHAPGRVNLIGEHTDYNGGYVFPAALTFGTTMLARKREDGIFRCASTHYSVHKEINIQDEIVFQPEDDWVNYPKAMIHHLKKQGFSFSGADVLFHGEIPSGAGLSSSASIEVVTGFGMLSLEGYDIDKVNLALTAQEAENQFIKVNCGIMDQFAVTMGKEGHAILLKCDNLDHSLIPFQARGYNLIIGNTNKRRGLVDSEYNKRRSQCEEAVHNLKNKYPEIKNLCDLSSEEFQSGASLISDDVVRKRAEHVIYENDRVLQSVKALHANQFEEFGRLMNASHVSLKDLYEVTCIELDVLVAEAQKIDGVLGSRMTGAGFGGCTVSLVEEGSVESFIEIVGAAYKEQTGLTADFYVCDIGDGVKEIK